MFNLQNDEKRQAIFTISVVSAMLLIIILCYPVWDLYGGPKLQHHYMVEVTFSNGDVDTFSVKYGGVEIDTLILDEGCIKTYHTSVVKTCGVRNFTIIEDHTHK